MGGLSGLWDDLVGGVQDLFSGAISLLTGWKPDRSQSKAAAAAEQVPAAPPAPDLGTAAAIAEERARIEAEQKKKKRRGRASTILTGPEGAGLPQTAAKTLLGE